MTRRAHLLPYDGTSVPRHPRRLTVEYAMAGTPGVVTGVVAREIDTIADLNAATDWSPILGPDPWPEGTWIEYGENGRDAHWTGARFKSGKAPA